MNLVKDYNLAAVAILLSLAQVFAAGPGAASGEDKHDRSLPQVIGGTPSVEGSYPWMVAILRTDIEDNFEAQFCGGTLIAPNVVLSAAHCFARRTGQQDRFAQDVRVLSGTVDLSGPNAVIHEVARVTIHEDFNVTDNVFSEDVALLHLTQPVDYQTLPLNLSPDNDLANPGQTARVMGWGARAWDLQSGPSNFPRRLHEADLPLVSNEECSRAPNVELSGQHLCAGFVAQGGVDACQLDSGGPLIVPDGTGGFIQIGITSFGFGCAQPGRPGVYSRVSSFADWIAENLTWDAIIPHWANGQTLITDLIVYNPSGVAEARSEVIFRDRAGNDLDPLLLLDSAPASEPTGSEFDGRNLLLPPQGIRTISTTGAGDLVSGSIRIESSNEVSVAIRFRLPGVGIAGLGQAEVLPALMFPARRDGGLSTGVAIHNPGSEAVTVDLTLKDEAGIVVANGSAELDLPPGAQVAMFFEQLFPDAQTDRFWGSICGRVRNGGVTAVALELGDQPGEFTTLPVSLLR